MRITLEFENGGELSFEAVSELETQVTVLGEGEPVKLTRWDLYTLEGILGTLRNKQEREPGFIVRPAVRGPELKVEGEVDYHDYEDDTRKAPEPTVQAPAPAPQSNTQPAPQARATGFGTPTSSDVAKGRAIVEAARKIAGEAAIALPIRIDPNNPPDTIVFLDKNGNEQGRIENVGSIPQA